MKTVTGNILDAEDDLICHQTNCVTTGDAAGLAAALFEKFPYSDIYKNRLAPHPMFREAVGATGPAVLVQPGTIVVCGDGIMERRVVAMNAQMYPGGPKPPKDGTENRLFFFQHCLDEIAKIPHVDSIAFPWQIGCGLAKGDWEKYSALLHEFSGLIDAEVTVYQWIA